MTTRLLTPVECAWLACAIDGEGYIYSHDKIDPRTGWRLVHVEIGVVNTDRRFAARAGELLGNTRLYSSGPRDRIGSTSYAGRKEVLKACIRDRARVASALEAILPFLIIKQDKARAALALAKEPRQRRYSAERRAQTSARTKEMWRTGKLKPNKGPRRKGAKKSADARARQSEINRARWADPAKREEHSKRMREAWASGEFRWRSRQDLDTQIMTQRLLITGGCGFLGSHLVEHFLKTTDYKIVILDKLTYASNGFDRLRDIVVPAGESVTLPSGAKVPALLQGAHEHRRVKIIGCDLSQPIPEGVRQEVGAVDYVIHAAAETHVDNSIVDPMPFIQSNVLGTHHLLWWLRRMEVGTIRIPSGPVTGVHAPPKRIFLVSTDEVYGPAAWDSPGNVESDPFRPANPYAAAKAGGECLAMAYANTYKLPITIVNTMNLYGERQHHEKFIPLVIRRALLGEKVLIHADPTKTKSGTRFYIHCRNYASALAWAIERDMAAYVFDNRTSDLPLKLHVSGEREISNLDLAQMIAGFVGKPLNYELVDFHSSRPGHDLRYALDDSKIRSMGWSQPINIDESLRRTVEWYLRDENRRWLGI